MESDNNDDGNNNNNNNNNGRISSHSPPRSDVESTHPACDLCYSRKVKCDRKDPCGNCKDSNVICLRERQKLRQKPREHLSTKLDQATRVIQQIDARMAVIEKTVTSLVNSSQRQDVPEARPQDEHVGELQKNGSSSTGRIPDSDKSGIGSRKRKPSEAFGRENAQGSISVGESPSVWSAYIKEPNYSIPSFSTTEAQNLIQQELNQGIRLSKQKREAFRSALASLSESLNTSYNELNSGDTASSLPDAKEVLENPSIPPLEAIQWMLQPPKKSDGNYSLPDGLPILGRKTLTQMVLDVQDANKRQNNPAALVCVNSFTSHFLLESVMATKEKTGLEEQICEQITAYFATAQAALSQINLLSPPSLQNLQALLLGAVNAQEAGDPIGSWNLSAAACNICIALGLHRKVNAFTNASPETSSESRFCLLLCYINDRGLAMNLGRPPCIADAYIEVELRDIPSLKSEVPQFLQHYVLEMAIVQSSIIELQVTNTKLKPDDHTLKIASILQHMDDVWQMIAKIPESYPQGVPTQDLEFECIMAKFAFYTIKTVLLHSCFENARSSYYTKVLLDSARASMDEMKAMRALCKKAEFNDYKMHSFAHWTILYYPFTPFFVLFCNVISEKHFPDFHLMEEFVEYLTEVKSTSSPVDKLHKLCLPFYALASSLLKNTDETLRKETDSTRTSKRHAATRASRQRARAQAAAQIIAPQPPGPGLDCGEQIVPQQGAMISFTDGAFDFVDDEFVSQFMGAQPLLQWLDSDFSAFEETWAGLGFEQDGMGFPRSR